MTKNVDLAPTLDVPNWVAIGDRIYQTENNTYLGTITEFDSMSYDNSGKEEVYALLDGSDDQWVFIWELREGICYVKSKAVPGSTAPFLKGHRIFERANQYGGHVVEVTRASVGHDDWVAHTSTNQVYTSVGLRKHRFTIGRRYHTL